MNFINNFIYTKPSKRFLLSAVLSSPVLLYYPIRASLADRSDTTRPDNNIKRLIDEVIREQNLKHKNYDLLVKDVLEFKLYPNWIGKSTLIIPKYLNIQELDELKSSYINELIKKEFNLTIDDKDKWFTEEGKKIISSFLLTDQAKKYLLLKNLNSLNSESCFSYYSLLLMLFYIPAQLAKWKTDIYEIFKKDRIDLLKEQSKLPKHKQKKLSFFKSFFLAYKNSILLLFVFTFVYWLIVCYYLIGAKDSRDADALTLSRGLANATTIKSKLTLIDFNYYSGGEEAYRKLMDRDQSLNKLFFKDLNDYERLIKRIPFDSNGDKLSLFSNQISVSSSYKNLSEWEKNSSY